MKGIVFLSMFCSGYNVCTCKGVKPLCSQSYSYVCCLTGTNRATLVERHVLDPVGLAVYGNHVYWIDQESRWLKKIEKISEMEEDFGSTVQGYIDGLTDMIVVDMRKSTGTDVVTKLPFCHFFSLMCISKESFFPPINQSGFILCKNYDIVVVQGFHFSV